MRRAALKVRTCPGEVSAGWKHRSGGSEPRPRIFCFLPFPGFIFSLPPPYNGIIMNARNVVFAAGLTALVLALSASTIRAPKDRVGFCWDSDTMNRLVDTLRQTRPLIAAEPGWIAAICPHDDYLYAGRLYLPIFSGLRAAEVVVIGVTHAGVRRALQDPRDRIILDTHPAWTGLERPVEVSGLRDWLRERMPADMIRVSDRAQKMEHSIEAMIPFLQYFRPQARITPIMVTAMSPARLQAVSRKLAEQVAAWMQSRNLAPGRDVAFLISADGNHYGPDFKNSPYGTDAHARAQAEGYERGLIQSCLEGTLEQNKLELLQKRLDPQQSKAAPLWCGRYSIPFGLMTVLHLMREWSPGVPVHGRLLGWSDTWIEGVLPLRHTSLGITAPFSLEHWVSFFAMAFYSASGV